MGASSWAYFVPYQIDVSQALQKLRETVFQSGEYFTKAKFLAKVVESAQGRMPSETLQRFQAELAQLKDKPQSRNIQELLLVNGENGTHSIIDIEGISESPDFGKVVPLSAQHLMKFFGTERPTREAVEEKTEEILGLCRRWEGVYFTVFQNGSPSEICFIGISGD